MTAHSASHSRQHPVHGHPHACGGQRAFLRRWFLANSLISGLAALCWLVLRSGPKPSRFAYPCQQAALSAATLAFGTPVVATVLTARRKIAARLRTPGGIALAALGLIATAGMWGYASWADGYRGPQLEPRGDYRAQVYHVADCPEDPAGQRFVGLDNLLLTMGRGGLKFYESTVTSLLGGPDGIIAADDVVVIKINYQWSERGGTNTDLLRGLIGRIVDHPDTFTGEVVVCENAQFASTSGFDHGGSNAQDHGLSPHDVVVGFQSQGRRVSHFDWTNVRSISVNEYSNMDMSDGYVVYPYDGALHGRVSYPKFQTDEGTYISLRNGIWDPIVGSYDREHLKFINVPVLKSHSIYGVTANVKDYMGVVTGTLSTNSHNSIAYGILGAQLGEIQPADLNILDCIWINAIPQAGPGTSYEQATRRDELVASIDPVAADMWAVNNILVPAFQSNGFFPPYPLADPEDAGSAFRNYLDNSMNYILAAGYDATNDMAHIDATTGDGRAGDFDADGDVDAGDYNQFAGCFTGPGGGPVDPGCRFGDFDSDTDVDCDDWAAFGFVWTDLGVPPDPGGCVAVRPAGYPPNQTHHAAKHRYLSINTSANIGQDVAFKVDLVSMRRCSGDRARACSDESDCEAAVPGSGLCVEHPDVGVAGPWWVQAPQQEQLGCRPGPCGDEDWFARVDSAPYFDAWTLNTLHIGACEVIPVATYMIRACLPPDGVVCSDSLIIGTIEQPFIAPGFRVNYGDVVGPVDAITEKFAPPDGFTNVVDVSAYILTNQNYGTANKPQTHPTWVDLHGLGDGNPPQYILGVSDLQQILKAFAGDAWTDDPENMNPGECP